MAYLTLPPEVGKRYRFRNKRTSRDSRVIEGICEITEEDTHEGDKTFRSQDDVDQYWVYWEDGKAKIPPYGKDNYVAELIEDVYTAPELPKSEEFKRIERMMKELKR